jgi:hypothetical protein
VARAVQEAETMDHRSESPFAPSFSATLGRTLELAQRIAADEIRLLQLDSQERLLDALRRSAWIGFGALCLGVAWVAIWAAALVALEAQFSLEARLAMLAISQLLLGAALVAQGLRRRAVSR